MGYSAESLRIRSHYLGINESGKTKSRIRPFTIDPDHLPEITAEKQHKRLVPLRFCLQTEIPFLIAAKDIGTILFLAIGSTSLDLNAVERLVKFNTRWRVRSYVDIKWTSHRK